MPWNALDGRTSTSSGKMLWNLALFWILHVVGLVICPVNIVTSPKGTLEFGFNDIADLECKMSDVVQQCVWLRNGRKVTIKGSGRYRFLHSNGSRTKDCSFFVECLRPIDNGTWRCSFEVGSDDPNAPEHSVTVLLRTEDLPENYTNDSCAIPNQARSEVSGTATVSSEPKSPPPFAAPTAVEPESAKGWTGLDSTLLVLVIVAGTVVVVVTVIAVTLCCYFRQKAILVQRRDSKFRRSDVPSLDPTRPVFEDWVGFWQRQSDRHPYGNVSLSREDTDGYLRPNGPLDSLEGPTPRGPYDKGCASYHHYYEIQ